MAAQYIDIQLSDNNLYAYGYLNVYAEDNSVQLLRTKLDITAEAGDQYHTVIQGDRIDLIAFKFYKKIVDDSSKLWWIIADANNVQNPLDISSFIGTVFLIPDYFRVNLILQSLTND